MTSVRIPANFESFKYRYGHLLSCFARKQHTIHIQYYTSVDQGYYGSINVDELVKSLKNRIFVIPVKTGIQDFQTVKIKMDSRLRGNDDFLRVHQRYENSFVRIDNLQAAQQLCEKLKGDFLLSVFRLSPYLRSLAISNFPSSVVSTVNQPME